MAPTLAVASTAGLVVEADEFAQFYDRYWRRLVGFAARAFPHEDAEEVAQETLCRVYARFDQLRPESDPWPWMTTIARNIARDLIRARSRVTTVDADLMGSFVTAHTPGADDIAVSHENVQEVRSALELLPMGQRRILRMREVDELSCVEIADFLGIQPNTVRQQLFRARRALARAYSGMLAAPQSLVLPVVAAAFRRLRRPPRPATPVTLFAPVVATMAVFAALTATLVIGSDAQPAVAPESPSLALKATVVKYESTPARPATVEPLRGQRRATRQAALLEAGPVTVKAGALRPLGRGTNYAAGVTITTPAGDLWVETTGVTNGAERPVCEGGLLPVDCS
jgi:RNA polymerase sigma-70 factor (ECF subfamily)